MTYKGQMSSFTSTEINREPRFGYVCIIINNKDKAALSMHSPRQARLMAAELMKFADELEELALWGTDGAVRY